MKFIVDELPPTANSCPFSFWKPYPPIVKEPGDYYCNHDKSVCDLCENGCRWLKKQETDKSDAITLHEQKGKP